MTLEQIQLLVAAFAVVCLLMTLIQGNVAWLYSTVALVVTLVLTAAVTQ